MAIKVIGIDKRVSFVTHSRKIMEKKLDLSIVILKHIKIKYFHISNIYFLFNSGLPFFEIYILKHFLHFKLVNFLPA